MTTTRLVSIGDVVDQVATVLQRAWPAPAIHYSLDYCSWQFRFPGARAPIAAATLDGDRLVGSVVMVPRRLSLAGRIEPAWLLSFLAVAPDYQRRGLARELYRVVLPEVAASGWPMVVFAKTDSPGHRLIVSEPEAAGLVGASLGDYVIHGFMDRGRDAPLAVETCSDVAALNLGDGPDGLLCSRPDVLQLHHYASGADRRIAVVRDPGGDIAGAAVVNRTEYGTQKGRAWAAIVDSFLIPPSSPEALQSLLTYAVRELGSADSPVCTAPNVATLNPDWFRPIGLRRTPTSYSGIVYAADPGHPFLAAARTNLEIV